MNEVKVTVIPYKEPKKSERTWNQRGYVWATTRTKVNLKEKGFHK